MCDGKQTRETIYNIIHMSRASVSSIQLVCDEFPWCLPACCSLSRTLGSSDVRWLHSLKSYVFCAHEWAWLNVFMYTFVLLPWGPAFSSSGFDGDSWSRQTNHSVDFSVRGVKFNSIILLFVLKGNLTKNLKRPLVLGFLCCGDTMTTAALIKKTFNGSASCSCSCPLTSTSPLLNYMTF